MLDKHKAFALINADIFCDYDYSRLRAGAKTVSTTKSCHLILAANPPEHPQGDFSLSANGVLLPPHGDTYTYTGIGVFHPSLFEKLKAEEKHKLLPILQAQIKKQKATAEIHDGLWHDTGTPAALARARKHWKI